ncbi:MAG: ribonuclease E/G, partial [Paludibacteraceae bacterium]
VKLYEGTQPIFDKFDITRQMKTGLGRVVGFKHGGYLIIDRTEALFSIDVNSGSKKIFEDQEENAYQFNMLAAEELAHQLRLRDIGGIIIVDFIDMDSKEHQQQLYDYMRKLMERDRARHNVLPLSKFGLMQITRQRVRPAVEMEVMEVCPTCMGKGKVQPTLLFTDQVQEEIEHFTEHFGKRLRLHLHPFVYSYATRGLFSSLANQWRRKFGVRVIENQSLGMLETRFFDAQGNPLQLPKEEKKDEKKADKQEEKQTTPAEEKKEPQKAAPAAPKKETTKKAAPAAKKEPKNAVSAEPKKTAPAETKKETPTEKKKATEEPKKAEKKANKEKQPNPQNGEK